VDLILNYFIEYDLNVNHGKQKVFLDFSNAMDSILLKPINKLFEDIEKSKIKADYSRTYYMLKNQSAKTSMNNMWYYQIDLLDNMIKKVD